MDKVIFDMLEPVMLCLAREKTRYWRKLRFGSIALSLLIMWTASVFADAVVGSTEGFQGLTWLKWWMVVGVVMNFVVFIVSYSRERREKIVSRILLIEALSAGADKAKIEGVVFTRFGIHLDQWLSELPSRDVRP